MLKTSTLDFIRLLKENNNTAWFHENKALYENAKQDVLQLAETLIAQFGKIDAGIAHLEAKDCLFRINRDIRFSADKSPYKTNFAIIMAKGGKKYAGAGYYLHIEPESSMLASGVYGPMPPELKKVRQEIAYNLPEFEALLQQPDLAATFGKLWLPNGHQLSRVPAGYEADHPAADYLKLKSYLLTRPLSDELLCSKDLVPTLIAGMQLLKPFAAFINRAIDD